MELTVPYTQCEQNRQLQSAFVPADEEILAS
jgi:hypothetical protein